jgi:hypothetical protein
VAEKSGKSTESKIGNEKGAFQVGELDIGSVEMREKNFIECGGNATGKTGFCDRIDFGGTGGSGNWHERVKFEESVITKKKLEGISRTTEKGGSGFGTRVVFMKKWKI